VYSSGCYTYVPAAFPTIPTGERVRVYLSQAGAARLREIGGDAIPGLGERPVVAGRLVRRDATEFSLQIPIGARQTGFLQEELDQQVTLPVAELVQVERRQVSGVRSALAVVAGTAALTALVVTVLKGARNPSPSTGGDPDNLRAPIRVDGGRPRF
jgi:hypothetical protein